MQEIEEDDSYEDSEDSEADEFKNLKFFPRIKKHCTNLMKEFESKYIINDKFSKLMNIDQ